MNKPKRSLRSTLQGLTATLVAGILAAARESLLELRAAQRRPPARRERARAVRLRTIAERTSAVEAVATAAAEAASDLSITDPQALLTALETATPAAWSERAPREREEPEILRPVSAVAPPPESTPALREGEVIVRRSMGGVVLRRRRA